ncbi:hypothetical protein HaLaN_20392, partial [Haematococcus lacustris]
MVKWCTKLKCSREAAQDRAHCQQCIDISARARSKDRLGKADGKAARYHTASSPQFPGRPIAHSAFSSEGPARKRQMRRRRWPNRRGNITRAEHRGSSVRARGCCSRRSLR